MIRRCASSTAVRPFPFPFLPPLLSLFTMLTLSLLLPIFTRQKTDMAAFTSALDRRRQDYQILRLGLAFPRPLSSASLTSAPLSSSSTVSISVPPTSSASSVSSGTLTSGAGTGTGTGAGESGVINENKEETKLEGEAETINPVFEEFWPEGKDKLLTLEDCNLLVRPRIPCPIRKPEISRKARSHIRFVSVCFYFLFFFFFLF